MRSTLLAALLLTASGVFAQVDPNTVYGPDDRVDLYQVKDAKVLGLADSTVALFQGSNVTVDGGNAKLATASYGEGMGLCKEEPFYSQRTGAFCSGSLVAPDIIMTAGHCVTSDDSCAGTKFVFGFGIKQDGGVTPESVPTDAVYSCAKLLGRQQENAGADWALVRLDRPAAGHAPLTLSKAVPANGDPIFVIGHPAGLPTKVAGGAKIRDASPEGFFRANTDTFGGNSGSAVFDAKTGLVAGVLVRGEQDYEQKGDCRVSKACPDDGCRGEDITKIGAVAPNIPPGAAPRMARGAMLGNLPAILASFIEPRFDSAR